jgi:hypothetical protein
MAASYLHAATGSSAVPVGYGILFRSRPLVIFGLRHAVSFRRCAAAAAGWPEPGSRVSARGDHLQPGPRRRRRGPWHRRLAKRTCRRRDRRRFRMQRRLSRCRRCRDRRPGRVRFWGCPKRPNRGRYRGPGPVAGAQGRYERTVSQPRDAALSGARAAVHKMSPAGSAGPALTGPVDVSNSAQSSRWYERTLSNVRRRPSSQTRLRSRRRRAPRDAYAVANEQTVRRPADQTSGWRTTAVLKPRSARHTRQSRIASRWPSQKDGAPTLSGRSMSSATDESLIAHRRRAWKAAAISHCRRAVQVGWCVPEAARAEVRRVMHGH